MKKAFGERRIAAKFLLLLILLAIFGCGTGHGPTSVVDPTTGRQLSLLWSDEFDGAALDASKWNVETGYGPDPNSPGWGNDEWQLYTGSSDNIKVENGHLAITARVSGSGGKRDGTITSGRINTKGKFNVKYGVIQARIKVPGGKGTWPAFWMLGANIDTLPWPKCGEIDVMEVTKYDAADKTTHATVHWYDQTLVNGTEKGWTYTTGKKTFADSLSNDYHVYEVDWNADRIIGKIDGAVYFTRLIDPASMEEFLRDFYLLFDVAVGGNLAEAPNSSGTSWPQTMYVDWVRVYGTPAPATTEAALFSETRSASQIPYSSIINSADWSGDSAIPNPNSTAVTPKEGTRVLSAQFKNDLGKGWNGIFFNLGSADVSGFGSYFFSLDASQFTDLHDLKIEFTDNTDRKGSVMLSSLTPTVSGNWSTYQVPLNSIAQADLAHLVYLGYVNPVNASGQAVAGTLYLDDLYFGACTLAPSVQFTATSYAANATTGTITVTDRCTGAATRPVLISNGSESISVNVTLNASGSGSATVNFGATSDATDTIALNNGATLTASYGSGAATVTGTAAVTAASVSTLVGDRDPKDGAVYLYASNPATVIDLIGGVNYTVRDNWSTGSVFDMAYADATLGSVIAVTPGSGWGISAACLAYTGFPAGFATSYSTLHFKFKGHTSVSVKFPGATTEEVQHPVSSATSLGNGWYQFAINIPATYGTVATTTEMGIFVFNSAPFYLTDLYFD
ncbi:hypothetical protein GMLC_08100 [Geomonas limicola]|uniref:GH16 domain-containing protein n=1 Tax=Geomonas limicola TaxID=2740186 RepID=A0A6V8N455_9BACT|nr:glycoside hydrolase family 16 protein [Geomonas limicola]GFO67231.1 hypothetical protein GMLC_08100 [Geomonas limicola]